MSLDWLKAIVIVVLVALAVPSRGEVLRMPLRELTAAPDLVLKCVTDSRELSVPLPERWTVRQASLRLRYAVSNNIAPDSSQLVVRLNGTVVAQTRLASQAPDAEMDVALPLALLSPGYNRLAIEVIQHAALIGATGHSCESPCMPDMWTRIDLDESSLDVDYEANAVPLDLSKLSSVVFDPRLTPMGRVHIVTEDLSEAATGVAAVVASGIARRFDYRKVSFSISRDLKPGVDNVLVGKSAFTEQFLSLRGVALPAAEGGYLKLLPLPGSDGKHDPTHALLVITGASDAAVRIAAMTFSSISFAFPGGDELRAFKYALPDLEQYSGREVLSSDRQYSFKTLNFPNHTFRGFNAGPRRINFRLPVDFHIRPNQYAALTLNFSYGAGAKSNSALNVLVNGNSVRAIPITDMGGGYVEGYKIDIPTYLFKPGGNVLEFQPHLNVDGKVCDLIQTDHLFLSIYENSTLKFPAMPHMVEMPRIELFMYNGFPFTRWPDGAETTILLAEQSDAVVTAAFNLIGMISQRNGFPLLSVAVSYGSSVKGEVIAVGAVDKLPEALRKASPLRTDGSMASVPYPVIRSWQEEVTFAYSDQVATLGTGRAVLMQFQSPFEAGRTVLVFSAADNDDLVSVSRELLNPAVQAQARGDVVLIELAEPEPKVSAMDTGKHYIVGKAGSSQIIESLLFTRPVLFYAVLVALLGLVSIALYYVLRRHRARRPTGQ